MLFIAPIFYAVFLPLTLIGFWVLTKHARGRSGIVWLVAASLAFYAYWDPRFLSLLLASIAVNFWVAKVMSGQQPQDPRRKILFIVAVVANLGALALFKYANFAAGVYATLTGAPARHFHILLPLGISFFTFTQLAYLADVRRGHPAETVFSKYVLFITYFPHLIAGPILHHKEMMGQFDSLQKRGLSTRRLALGVSIFAIGLFKKVVVADTFASIADPVFSAANQAAVGMADSWLAALAYALQIYFDFSGYCDMAIGISTMLNIRLPFNFDSPYKSSSIIEFWRRWHITLSRFLRDYLYIPLGGNRKGRFRELVNLLLTMLLGGLWHGAGWTFLVWGGLHGVYLVINHGWRKLCAERLQAHANQRAYWVAGLVATQLSVVVAWVFFRADSLQAAGRILKAMFGFAVSAPVTTNPGTVLLIVTGYLVCLAAPNVNDMFCKYRVGLITYRLPASWSALNARFKPTFSWAAFIAAAFVFSLAVEALREKVSPFLYFQF